VALFGTIPAGKDISSWKVHKGNVSVKDMVRIYNQSKIYICSSLAEGFAFPPAEAMACGCAVVSTDCGSICQYAIHGVNALPSPSGVPQALAQNIIQLIEDDDLRVKLARTGHEQIQNFTWEKTTDRFERVISD
jgi:glycosyltransferase involved in cell wall biosynthesis